MFEEIKKRVNSAVKKVREIAGSPKIWGTVAVFSPTLVACYGVPYDANTQRTEVYEQADCIDGYIHLVEGLNILDTAAEHSVDGLNFQSATQCSEKDSSEDMICKLRAVNGWSDTFGYADCRAAAAGSENAPCSDKGTCKMDCSGTMSEPCNPSCSGNTLFFWNSGLRLLTSHECNGECVQDSHYAWCRYKGKNGAESSDGKTDQGGTPGQKPVE